MSFIFECPFCHKKFSAEDAWNGDSTNCPNCNQQVLIESPQYRADRLRFDGIRKSLQYDCNQEVLEEYLIELNRLTQFFPEAKACIKECQEKINDTVYRAAIAAKLKNKNYELAIKKLDEIINYKDAREQKIICIYEYALDEAQGGHYEMAVELFTKIQDYKDAREQIEICKKKRNKRLFNFVVALIFLIIVVIAGIWWMYSIEQTRIAEQARKARMEQARQARMEQERMEQERIAQARAFDNLVERNMIKVKAGSFKMGSPMNESGRASDETQHSVTLTQDYWLGATEVTQRQWDAVMGYNPEPCFISGGDYPVENVSWNDAMSFCAKLNEKYKDLLPDGYEFSLPTEAQWEYACRAGETGPYSGGTLDEVAWYNGNCDRKPHKVGQKKPNAWGFYDMHGNVWEWCRDYWCYRYDTENVKDPTGPKSGSSRVLRGGGWYNCYANSCRSASRSGCDPSDRRYTHGFRLALVPVQ